MLFTGTRKFILLITACLLFILATGFQVFAGQKNEAGREHMASISLCLRDPVDDSAIDAACFSLYRVAVPAEVEGEELFCYTPDFAACGIELNLEQADLLARRLADYAGQHLPEAADQKTTAAGRLCFSPLPEGLYLLVQEGSVGSYYPAAPFLVPLPLLNADGSLTYEPEAFPKIERTADPGAPASDLTEPDAEPDPETDPSSSPETKPAPQPEKTDPPHPPHSDEPRLIQTGQVNWPIPVLVTTGFLFFAYGWRDFLGGKDEEGDTGEAGGGEDPAKDDDEES